MPYSPSSFRFVRIAAIFCFVGTVGNLFAADATWNGTVDADYNNAANWSGVVPFPAGTATFNNAGNGNTTLTNTSTTINVIRFDTVAAAAFTLGASVGDGLIILDQSFSGGVINSTNTVITNQLINSNLQLGIDGSAYGNYSFNNAATGTTMTIAGTVTGGPGGVAGAKILTLQGVGGGTVSGVVANGGASSLGVSIGALSTWTLTAANTFGGRVQSGTDTINYTTGLSLGNAGGTVILSNNDAVGNDSIYVTSATATIRAGASPVSIPGGIVSNNSNYTIGGTSNLTVNGVVSFNGTSTLTISNTGLTTLANQLQLRNRTTSNGGITISGAGTLAVTGDIVNNKGGSNDAVTPVPIAAVGSLTYAGTGTLKSSGTNTYTGTTTINGGGSFLVNGSHIGGTTYTIAAGNKLGGSGVITPAGTNAVTINGILAAGDSTLAANATTGSLDIGKLTFGAGSTLNSEIGGASPGDGVDFYDQVNVTTATAAGLTINAATNLSLSLINAYVPTGSELLFILTRNDLSATTAFSGLTEGASVLFQDGITTGKITYLANWTGTQGTSTLAGGNDIAIYNLAAVPEPGSLALLLGAGVLLIVRRARCS